MRLGGVLDDHGVFPGRDLGDGCHRRQLAEEVHREHRPGPRAQNLFQGFRIEQEVVWIHVGERGTGAGPHDRFRGGDEGIRRHDHLSSGADPGRAQGQLDRVGAVGHADAVRDAREGRVVALEGFHRCTLDEGGARHHVIEPGLDLGRYLSMRSSHVDQRYRRDGLGVTRHFFPSWVVVSALVRLVRDQILLPLLPAPAPAGRFAGPRGLHRHRGQCGKQPSAVPRAA